MEEGDEVLNYRYIQDTLQKNIGELFARETIMPATTKMSGPAWRIDNTEIFCPEFKVSR